MVACASVLQIFCVLFALCVIPDAHALPKRDLSERLRKLLFHAQLEETIGYKAPNVVNLPPEAFEPENRQAAGVTDPEGNPKKYTRGLFFLDHQGLVPHSATNYSIVAIENLHDRWADRVDRVNVLSTHMRNVEQQMWNDLDTKKVRPVLVCPEFFWLPKPGKDKAANRLPPESEVKSFIENSLIPLSNAFPRWLMLPGTILFEPDGVSSGASPRPYYNAVPVLFNGDHKFWIHKVYESNIDVKPDFPAYHKGLGMTAKAPVCQQPYSLADIEFRTEICLDHKKAVAKGNGNQPTDLHIVIAGGMNYEEQSQCADTIWVVDHSLFRCKHIVTVVEEDNNGPVLYTESYPLDRAFFPALPGTWMTLLRTNRDVPLGVLAAKTTPPKTEVETPLVDTDSTNSKEEV